MDNDPHFIPFDIEAPVPVLFWEPLDFALAVSFTGFGIALGLFIPGVIGAFGVLYGSKYLKRGAKRGAAQHYLWGLGLNIDKYLSSNFLPADKNEFIE